MLAVLALSTALVFPVAMGVLQGLQRFSAVGALYVLPWLVRLAVLGIAAAAGYRLGGAVFATVVGAVAATALALFLIREPLRGAAALPRAELMTFLRYLWPVAVGLVGIALLTNVDILIVKARFSGDEAGAYAAASAFARVAFFLPGDDPGRAVSADGCPPGPRGRDRRHPRALAARDWAFCGLLALVYAAAGVGLVSMTFGAGLLRGRRTCSRRLRWRSGSSPLPTCSSRTTCRAARRATRGSSPRPSSSRSSHSRLVPSSLRGVVWTNVVVGGRCCSRRTSCSSVPACRRCGPVSRACRRRRALERAALRSRRRLVLLGATLFVCALMWPIVRHFSSTIIGSPGSDSTGSVSFLWTLQHESGYHLLGNTHHTLSGAPFGWDQGNGLNIQWSLPYYPAYLATKLFGAVAAYNLVTLAGYVLSGASMYLLVRYLRCSRLVATWAARRVHHLPLAFRTGRARLARHISRCSRCWCSRSSRSRDSRPGSASASWARRPWRAG